jgi:RHS repeat-associated protein
MAYAYDADNQRTVKYHIQAGEETLYFDQFWQGVNEDSDFRQSKHIYLGETRIATRLNLESRNGSTDSSYELVNTYYYHPDHLGSAQFVTDRDGGQYEHMEYTPYGELWEEQVSDSYDMIPFRFTAKEYDEETNLYYYGARYLDPKTSRWMSGDPAGAELLNPMEKDNEGKLVLKQNYFMVESFNWYSYVSNNPVKYIDPTGKWIFLGGLTTTTGAGTAVVLETGIAVSKGKDGNWQVGTYQCTGGGFYASTSQSITGSFTIAPLAREIKDVEGVTETIGGSKSILGIGSAGMDLNIPIDGSKKNFSITFNVGVSTPSLLPGEGHAFTTNTTTELYGEGDSFIKAFNAAVDNGMLEGLPNDVLEHFLEVYTSNNPDVSE